MRAKTLRILAFPEAAVGDKKLVRAIGWRWRPFQSLLDKTRGVSRRSAADLNKLAFEHPFTVLGIAQSPSPTTAHSAHLGAEGDKRGRSGVGDNDETPINDRKSTVERGCGIDDDFPG